MHTSQSARAQLTAQHIGQHVSAPPGLTHSNLLFQLFLGQTLKLTKLKPVLMGRMCSSGGFSDNGGFPWGSVTIVAKAGPFVRVKEAAAASKRAHRILCRKWGWGRLSRDWDWAWDWGGLALDLSVPLSFLHELQFGLWLQ